MNIYIVDQAEEFRIEITGRFADSAVSNAAAAWKAALLVNTPRRISVDITRMTGYDRDGFLLLQNMHLHGTHIAAGTPRSLLFFNQISSRRSQPVNKNDWSEKRPVHQPFMRVRVRSAATGD